MFRWVRPPDQVFGAGAAAWAQQVQAAVVALAASYAPKIETYMKANAPWTDRTANARQSLYARVDSTPTSVTITFDHGVDYGYYLEFKNTGRYAIVGPTLDHYTPILANALRRMLRP